MAASNSAVQAPEAGDIKDSMDCRHKSQPAGPPGYPWHLLTRTLLLLAAFLSLGLTEALKGPTLLDLQDLVAGSISQMSFIFVFGTIGSLVGNFVVGLLFDRFYGQRHLGMLAFLVLLGSFTVGLPYAPDVLTMYILAFFGGLGAGALDTGGNVLCLSLWAGRDSGPYMHALHFTFAAGTFLSPVVARPFLLRDEEEAGFYNLTEESNLTTTTSTTSMADHTFETSAWTIKTLYPMVGAFSLLLTPGFLLTHIADSKEGERPESSVKEDPGEMVRRRKFYLKLSMIAVMNLFFFLYVGMEMAYGFYITTFAVKCSLGLTRQQGTDVAAIFFGCFAAARGLAILAAIYLPPALIMSSSVFLCVLGSFFLAVWGDSSLSALQAGSAVMGLGMAAIYANGYLWMERRITITGRIGASFTVASSAGGDLLPLLVGQLIESRPMVLMWLQLGIVLTCALLFVVVNIISSLYSRLLKENSSRQLVDVSKAQLS